MNMSLSTLAVGLGLLLGLPHIYALAKPVAFAAAARKFPRSVPAGAGLMLLGTAWFLYYFNLESISDFAAMKPYMMVFFAAVGLGSCLYVQDYLGARGLAVVLLLLAKLMADTARWAETEWRLVVVSLAYVFVAAGIWITIYPWHLRDAVAWGTKSEPRIRLGGAAGLGLALVVLALGLTVFRASAGGQ